MILENLEHIFSGST